MLTAHKLRTHRLSPLRYDGHHANPTYSAAQHLIVRLLQATHYASSLLSGTPSRMLLKPLKHRWGANQHLRHAVQITCVSNVPDATQRHLPYRLPRTAGELIHGNNANLARRARHNPAIHRNRHNATCKQALTAKGCILEAHSTLTTMSSCTSLGCLELSSVALCNATTRQRLLLSTLLSPRLHLLQLFLLTPVSQAHQLRTTHASRDQILLGL